MAELPDIAASQQRIEATLAQLSASQSALTHAVLQVQSKLDRLPLHHSKEGTVSMQQESAEAPKSPRSPTSPMRGSALAASDADPASSSGGCSPGPARQHSIGTWAGDGFVAPALPNWWPKVLKI